MKELQDINVTVLYEEEILTYGERTTPAKRELGVVERHCGYKMDAYPIWFHHKLPTISRPYPKYTSSASIDKFSLH